MAFSLTYAFGKKGRTWRRVLGETHAFMRLKLSRIGDEHLSGIVLAHYLSALGIFTRLFFPDNESDPLYGMHRKYGDAVLNLTPQKLLKIVATYHCAVLMTIEVDRNDRQSLERVLTIINTLAFVYDFTEADHALWANLYLERNTATAAAILCQEISSSLDVPQHLQQSATDLIALVQPIADITVATMKTAQFPNAVKSVIEKGF